MTWVAYIAIAVVGGLVGGFLGRWAVGAVQARRERQEMDKALEPIRERRARMLAERTDPRVFRP